MTKREYNSKRAFAIRLFGIIMLINGVSLMLMSIQDRGELKRCTAVTTATVVAAEEKDGARVIKISHYLDGDWWLVTKESDGLEVGNELNVYYNPENEEEKYIEGFRSSSSSYLILGGIGAAAGLAALFFSRVAKVSKGFNEVLDIVDKAP